MSAIAVRSVTKFYRMGVGRARVREMLPWPFDRAVARTFPRWWYRNTFRALDDVSLDIPAGSSVGIVGHNGAGKTTLLKIIAGVTEASTGSVSVHGRTGALIDLMIAFHPDLTGRENAHLLASLQGFGRRGMGSFLDRIVEFSGVREFADTPVKRFSTGMAARLAFGTLVAMEPEVLMIDEVLAVGDQGFQRKCLAWLEEYRKRGGTLLFVSHNLGLVRSMTGRVVSLDRGKVVDDGEPGAVLAGYASTLEQRGAEPLAHDPGALERVVAGTGPARWGRGGVRVREVHVGDEATLDGRALDVRVAYEEPEIEEAVFCVGFADASGRDIAAALSPTVRLEAAGGVVDCRIRPVPLRAGIYFPVVAILSTDGVVRDRWRLDRAVVVDRAQNVPGVVEEFGPVEIRATWSNR